MSRVSRGIVVVGVVAVLALGISPAKADFEPNLDHTELCSPDDPDFFHLNINNPYFPLLPGQVSTFLDPEEHVGLRIEVLNDTEDLYDDQDLIVTRVVKETEWFDLDGSGDVNGEDLIEISHNYYAQTDDGTVCYFGEAVQIFEEDGSISDEGSWRADEEPNAPGIFMPAKPRGGDVYLQEDAPNTALDVSDVTKFGTVTIDGTKYKRAMHTAECNLFEDQECTDIGTKVYAPGRGIVQDGDLQLTSFTPGTSAGSAKKR